MTQASWLRANFMWWLSLSLTFTMVDFGPVHPFSGPAVKFSQVIIHTDSPQIACVTLLLTQPSVPAEPSILQYLSEAPKAPKPGKACLKFS